MTELEQAERELTDAMINYVAACQRRNQLQDKMKFAPVPIIALQQGDDEEETAERLYNDKFDRYLMLKQCN